MNRIGILLVLSVVECFAQPAPPTPPAPPARAAKRVQVFGAASSFLGVGVAEIDAERAKALKLKEEHGVEVKGVEDDSPAAKAGVKVEDVVLEYNSQRVEGSEQFVRLVRETPVGRQVKLLISRNGSTQTLTPTIGSRSSAQFFPKGLDEMWGKLSLEMDLPRATMTMRSGALGVESQSLGSQLAEFFGVKEGALVRSVTRGSAAEKAGIKAGDVITKVGDRKVTSPSDIANAIRNTSGGTIAIPVTVVTNKKENVVIVTIEARTGGIRRSTVRMDVKTL